MRLSPPKPWWWLFDEWETLNYWKEQDKEALRRLNHPSVYESEWFDVSVAYTGLSCDGMHFGLAHDRAMFGCGGMHVATDVAIQLWLHRLLLPEEACFQAFADSTIMKLFYQCHFSSPRSKNPIPLVLTRVHTYLAFP